jgi:hypothetical protein
MQISKRAAVAMLAASALAGSATTAVSAFGDKGGGGSGNGDNRGDHHGDRGNRNDRFDRGDALLDTSLAPSVPTDPALHGVAPGGVPWVLKFGEARLRENGRIDVRIRGLVIPVAPENGTAGPVTMVSASLYCGNDTTPAGTTPSAPLSQTGDARIRGQFTLPAKCQVPALLIHPNGNNAAYIATSGFSG